jgi:hypothetical protein
MMDFKALVQQLMQMREGGQGTPPSGTPQPGTDALPQGFNPWWMRPRQSQHMSPMQAMQQPGYNPLQTQRGPTISNQTPRDQWTPGARWQGPLPKGAKFI